MGLSQAIREKRNPHNTKKQGIECVLRNTKGSLLWVGMARCGHCGNPLTITWNTKKYPRNDGTVGVKREAKYRCSGKATQKVKCSGKTIHSPIRLEGIVLDEIYAYLDQLETVDLKEQIEQIKSINSGDEEKALRKLQKLTDKAKMELTSLKDEVLKVIMGKSPLDRELVNKMVKEKESEVSLLLAKVEKSEQELNSKKVEQVEIQSLKTYIPVWREVFKKASTAKKKMMLSTIIECVRVYRDSVELTLKLNISSFFIFTFDIRHIRSSPLI